MFEDLGWVRRSMREKKWESRTDRTPKVAAVGEWGERTPNLDDSRSWYKIANPECSKNESMGQRLPEFPGGLHRVVDDSHVCETGKVDRGVAHFNWNLDRSQARRLRLVSRAGRRGKEVGVNFASMDLGGRGRDFK